MAIGTEEDNTTARTSIVGSGKSKLGFVDGRFPKSKFEPELHDLWEKVNAVVLSWIMNAVRPGLLSSVLYASSAHKVWEDLKERFDKVNGSRVLFLHREMHYLTQGTKTVADYFSKLRDLWDEFDALMPCLGCPCPESKLYAQHFEAQRLLQFLTGLNDSYAQSRSQIMMMTPVPTINKSYSLLVDQESQRNLASMAQVTQLAEGLESTALYGNKGPNVTSEGYRQRKNNVQCDYCHYKGHTKENCFKLIGYPPDFKSKRKGSAPGLYANFAGNPSFAAEEDHISCEKQLNTGSYYQKGVTSANPTTPQMTQTQPFFTQEQY
ncbi:PREDICTED: uncharacterized protein LOC109216356 [Nicotiana attenuata]|uniref:uncharacterized protein LOC109216356 n=1 Tax=Nicotiana attenuata TaxID=49451 RepID=UPI000904CB7E|nr:PREDICTED: uncharacterized protein LOC109216356 [Nicotiana attenuata]